MPEIERHLGDNALAKKFQELAQLLWPAGLEEKVRIEDLKSAAFPGIKPLLSVAYVPTMEVSTCITICLHGKLSVTGNVDGT